MGALTIKKEQYTFRNWRMQEHRILDFTDTFPYLSTLNNQDLTVLTIRPTYSWMADGARESLKKTMKRAYYNMTLSKKCFPILQ